MIASDTLPSSFIHVNVKKLDGSVLSFKVKLRIDTEVEKKYVLNGGVLQYVLREMVNKSS